MEQCWQMTDEELNAWVRLSTVPGLRLQDAVSLLEAFGSPVDAMDASRGTLRRHVPAEVADRIASGPEDAQEQIVSRTLAWLGRVNGAFAVTLSDPDFPKGLLETGCSPLVLYGLGDRELLGAKLVAILGTRHPSADGARDAYEFGAGLGKAGLTLLSPMMEGIDSESLRGALEGEGGRAVVLCAAPLDRVYPASRRPLMAQAAKTGLLLSSLAPGTPLTDEAVKLRYQHLAGLASAVLVMEAGVMSKAIPVARAAGVLGRDLLAVPGNIHLPLSKGPNRLIREGARLVESVQDVAGEVLRLSDPVPRLRDRPFP